MRPLIWISALPTAASNSAAESGCMVTDRLRALWLANLLGATAHARVSVYLPQSCAASPRVRYPALYLLHRFFNSDADWIRPDVRGMMGGFHDA
jgi:hypothetical protein